MNHSLNSHIIIIYTYMYHIQTEGSFIAQVLHTSIDQTLMSSLHRLLNCEIGGLDFHVITTEYRTRVHWYFVMHWSM